MLRRDGIEFQTENDTEVAAGYLTWRMRQGASLHEALDAGLKDLDGFYTFCVGTKDGFAVLRDPIACKHAVLAETDDWVAMATEYRAIARLPGADDGPDLGAGAGAGLQLGPALRWSRSTSARPRSARSTSGCTRFAPDTNERAWRIANPMGAHAVAVGLDVPVSVEIDGHVGYYCAGMNKQARSRQRPRRRRAWPRT